MRSDLGQMLGLIMLVVALTYAAYTHMRRCESSGGVMLKTALWYKCVHIDEVER